MIINGDCIEVMRGMESNSVDTVITDPPYGLKFMGKKWDYDIPSIEIWEECLRVAKPGATLLCFGGSRTYHRMTCAVEDAGWIIKDCIMWLYGSGFPKALDISKQMDKRAGAERTESYVRKDFAARSNKTEQKKSQCICGEKGVYTLPATEEAKQWDGWKSHGLKPAYEPIIVAMNPNDGAYVDNALKWGVSGFNIDECRIGEDLIPEIKRGKAVNVSFQSGGYTPEHRGRFPSNIILDEEAGKMLDEQSGITTQGHWAKTKVTGYGKTQDYSGVGRKAQDKGGASRFFYCAKSSKSEKNAGCGDLPKKQKIFNGQSDKSSTDIKDVEKRFTTQPVSNNHPTVKPLKLMEYLCKLTKTPTGGIVLDPFCGSGSTGIAAIRTGREFIGIEMDKFYCEIAEARIKNEKEN